MRNISKHIELNYQETLSEGFGSWIHNGVWYWMGEDRGLTFIEQKEAFFETLRKLLDDGKVVLCPPTGMKDARRRTQANWNNSVWDISSDEIIDYFREVFPRDVADENDLKLNDFWFSERCPQIGWVDQDTGEIYE